jgi:hypothetical protein
MKRGKYSGFPIDECAVAVEGENFEAGEVEHGGFILRCSYLIQSDGRAVP